jgi:hypothetical protein
MAAVVFMIASFDSRKPFAGFGSVALNGIRHKEKRAPILADRVVA